MVIAQAAGALLDIGFEMKDGIAVLGVAGAGELGEVLDDGVPFAQDERREQVILKAAIKGVVPAEIAAVEQGDEELKIVGIYAVAFLPGTDGRAGAEAGVPHGLNAGADDLMEIALHAVIAAEEEDVHVGVGKQLPAAEATGGDERDVEGAGVSGDQLGP